MLHLIWALLTPNCQMTQRNHVQTTNQPIKTVFKIILKFCVEAHLIFFKF